MKRQVITSGPWESVYNSSDSSEAYANKLYAASNMYKPKGGSSFVMRPPFQGLIAAGTLGTGGGRYGQRTYEHVSAAGALTRLMFVGGRVYRWDGGTTTTDVTPVGVTIAATTRIHCASLGDTLIVHDGTNTPWYVPSSGLGATPLVATKIFIEPTNTAWSATGPMAVWNSRLWFVPANVGALSTSDVVVWSEIDAPSIGYQQTNFADFWELSQTETRPIYGIAATEISLVVLRAESILNITGKTDQSFQTNATRESVVGVGTKSPNSILVQNGYVWFLDEQGRQYRYLPGNTPEPLWTQMADTVNYWLGLSLEAPLTAADICYHPDLNLVLSMSYGATASDPANTIYAFDAATGAFQGSWDIDGLKLVHAIDVVRVPVNGTSIPALVALGESTTGPTTIATSGQVWRQLTLAEMASGRLWSDTNGVPNSAIILHHLGRNEEGEWIFEQIALRAIENAGQSVSLTYYTPRGATGPITAVMSEPPTTPISPTITGLLGEARAVWGLGPNAQGRWLMPKISTPTNEQTTPPFTVTAVELRGTLTKATPQAP